MERSPKSPALRTATAPWRGNWKAITCGVPRRRRRLQTLHLQGLRICCWGMQGRRVKILRQRPLHRSQQQYCKQHSPRQMKTMPRKQPQQAVQMRLRYLSSSSRRQSNHRSTSSSCPCTARTLQVKRCECRRRQADTWWLVSRRHPCPRLPLTSIPSKATKLMSLLHSLVWQPQFQH